MKRLLWCSVIRTQKQLNTILIGRSLYNPLLQTIAYATDSYVFEAIIFQGKWNDNTSGTIYRVVCGARETRAKRRLNARSEDEKPFNYECFRRSLECILYNKEFISRPVSSTFPSSVMQAFVAIVDSSETDSQEEKQDGESGKE